MKMKQIGQRILIGMVIISMMIVYLPQEAKADINWGYKVAITGSMQVVDSITFNGVTVYSYYAPRFSGYDSDSTYCCAAFVHRFYSQVFGVSVSNLNPGNTPYVSSGYFYMTTSPQVGDIAASSGHWAIVKEVSGETVTLIEQNAWNTSYTQACVGRKLTSEQSYWYWHWSGNTGSFSYVDKGTNFHAILLKTDGWKCLTVNGDNVELEETEICNAREHWTFERQSDGTYIIISDYDGRVLDVCGAVYGNGTNVQVYTRWGDNNGAQRWYICDYDGAYRLIPKGNTSYSLDCTGGSSAGGTNIELWEHNNWGAQKFSIYMFENSQPLAISAGSLEINAGNTAQLTTKFTSYSGTSAPTGAYARLKYSSSNTSVATVDANGVVTAKASGDAVITVTSVYNDRIKTTAAVHVNKKINQNNQGSTKTNTGTKRSSTTTTSSKKSNAKNSTNSSAKRLQAPKVKVKKKKINRVTGINVTWTKTSGATGYIVYRKTKGAKSWTKIATIKRGSKVSYFDKRAKKGRTYTYAVKAVKGKKVSGMKASKSVKR